MTDAPKTPARAAAMRPIRRKARAAAETEASGAGPATGEPDGAPPARHGATLGFFTCLAIGLVFCIPGLAESPLLRKVGLIGPIAATVAYPVWGYFSGLARRPAIRERFADNCYYLGFIFTQAALLFAFMPITLWGRPVKSEEVLGFFGMAVGASLCGLIARTLIIQMGASVPEADDAIHGEVEDLARQVSERARFIVGEFDALAEKVSAVPTAMAERLDGELNAVATTLSRYDEVLRREIGAFERGTADVSDAAEKTVAAYRDHQLGFGQHMQRIAKSLEQLQTGLAGRIEQTVKVIEAGALAIAEAGRSLEGLSEARQDVALVRSELAAVAASTEALSASAKGVGAELGKSVDEATALIRVASVESAEAVRAAGANAAGEMERANAEAAAALGARSEALASSFGTIAASTETLSATAARLATEIDSSVVRAVETVGRAASEGAGTVRETAAGAASELARASAAAAETLGDSAAKFTSDLAGATAAFSTTLREFRDQLERLREEREERNAER